MNSKQLLEDVSNAYSDLDDALYEHEQQMRVSYQNVSKAKAHLNETITILYRQLFKENNFPQ